MSKLKIHCFAAYHIRNFEFIKDASRLNRGPSTTGACVLIGNRIGSHVDLDPRLLSRGRLADWRTQCDRRHVRQVNHLTGTSKPQSNGPLYSNTVIGTLAVDGWAVTFGTARRGLGGLRPGPVTVTSSLYQM